MAERDRTSLRRIVRRLRVTPGSTVSVPDDFDPRDTGGLQGAGEASAQLEQGVQLLARYQDRLSAQATHGVLLVLQGLDASGKDGTITPGSATSSRAGSGS